MKKNLNIDYNILFLTLTFVSFKMGLQFQQQKCVFSLFSPLSILYTLVNNRCAALSVSQSVVEQAVHSKYSILENRESVSSLEWWKVADPFDFE